jgi:hypothetical protein
MAPIETQQLRMLEQLRQTTGKQPMTLDQLRAGGIDFSPSSSASSSSTGT